MISYELVDFSDLDDVTCEYYGIQKGWDEGSALFRVEGDTRHMVYVDGGESEDMTLGRNLSAFITELEFLSEKVCG